MTSYGFLSTYPPTQCGLATFSASLIEHLTVPGSRDRAGVVQVVDGPRPEMSGDVVAQLLNDSPHGVDVASDALNGFDIAIVQHEYGIYGGADGQDVLSVLAGLDVPAIVVAHTVLAAPTSHQREVLVRVAAAAAVMVVMSETAARRLRDVYLVDPRRIEVIPHGALGTRDWIPAQPEPTRPTILTWGLIGPGKGIEWAIEAVGGLTDLPTPPRYLVAGETHPKVLSQQGDVYRDGLRRRAVECGVEDLVEFDACYRTPGALNALVRRADVVLLPYESTEQATSGVLIEAIAARRPVVATDFPHAVELLAGGAGLLVPHRDPAATSDALRRVLTDPVLSASMRLHAGRMAPALDWSAVADEYRRVATCVLSEKAGIPA